VPLSQPTSRKEVHTRTITLRGYEREDGLYDIEAHLTDTKTYSFSNEHRGEITPGTPLHGMWMRMTVDERLNILECEAATDHSPYAICPSAAPNFSRLAGLRIRPGFLREANSRIGGTVGCSRASKRFSMTVMWCARLPQAMYGGWRRLRKPAPPRTRPRRRGQYTGAATACAPPDCRCRRRCRC
jgi:hypothetical protein